MKKIGLIVNPWAGIGGQSAIKGSDNEILRKEAKDRGFSSPAPWRAAQVLNMLEKHKDKLELLAAPGCMGEDIAVSCGIPCRVIGTIGNETSAQDTVRIARQLKKENVDLLVFVGGDGTARDIFNAVGESQPCLGIPSGVKMHSAVYAVNPRQAGYIILDELNKDSSQTELREVMDIDEEAFSKGKVRASLYGYLSVPQSGNRLQAKKSQSASPEEQLLDLSQVIIQNMDRETLYLIGPGSTTFYIKEKLGIKGTLLGVDAVKNGKMLIKDGNEKELYSLMQQEKSTKIIITAIGGQGMLIGRGNQQLSPRILRKCGKDNILIAVTSEKLAALDRRPLLLDSGDPELDEELSGYYHIQTSLDIAVVYKVSN